MAKGALASIIDWVAGSGSYPVIIGLSLTLYATNEMAERLDKEHAHSNIQAKCRIAMIIIISNFVSSLLVIVDSIKMAHVLLLTWPIVSGFGILLILIYDLLHSCLMVLLGALALTQLMEMMVVTGLLMALHIYFYYILISIFETTNLSRTSVTETTDKYPNSKRGSKYLRLVPALGNDL